MHVASDRRSFLRTATVISLSATAANLSSIRTSEAEVTSPLRAGGARLKLALNAYSFSKMLNTRAHEGGGEVTLLSLVDYCAEQGFDALDATGYFFPGYPNVPDDAYVYELKRRAFDQGVAISGTGVRNNFTTADKSVRAQGVEHVKQWVEVAAKLGAPVVRVFADTQMKSQTWQTVAPGCSREEVERWIADDLRACAERGQKYGVIIGVQNHGDFLKSSDDHLSLVRRVNHPWCGPIVDTGYYKTADPYKDIADVAPYAVNWQVKESPISAGSEVRTDLKRLLTIVRQAGYRGYVPIETLSAKGSEYNPFEIVPRFLGEVREALEATASIQPTTPREPAIATSPPTVEPPKSTTPATARVPDAPRTRKPPNKNKRNSSPRDTDA